MKTETTLELNNSIECAKSVSAMLELGKENYLDRPIYRDLKISNIVELTDKPELPGSLDRITSRFILITYWRLEEYLRNTVINLYLSYSRQEISKKEALSMINCETGLFECFSHAVIKQIVKVVRNFVEPGADMDTKMLICKNIKVIKKEVKEIYKRELQNKISSIIKQE